MARHPESCRDRAEHYRKLAGLISDEATHRLLLVMAHELDEQDDGKPVADNGAGAEGASTRHQRIPHSLS